MIYRWNSLKYPVLSWLVLASGLLCLTSGCSSDSNADGQRIVADAAFAELQPEGAPELQLVVEDGLAVAVRGQDDANVPFRDGEAVVGDWLVVQRGDGKVEMHRTPQAIMRQLSRLPYVYMDPETGKRVETDGQQGTLYVDPETNRILWPALTCKNPQCSSLDDAEQPWLFAVELIRGTRVNSNGLLVAPPGGHDILTRAISCPRCGSRDAVKRYVSPQELDLNSRLQQELDRSRRGSPACR